MLKGFILKQINKRGYEVTKTGYSDKTAIVYRKIINQFGINHILDVGANEGQFALNMRKLGYNGEISSYEPLLEVFEGLRKKSENDRRWKVFNFALGNKDEQQEINVSKNTVSSSLLEMLPKHIKQEPDSIFIGKEKIDIRRLDTVWKESSLNTKSVFFKLDVQGYEKYVLEGASESLKHIKLIQLEMALTELYKGELLLANMIKYMETLGYILYNLVNGFNNFETGQLFQVDGIFVREDLIP
jgi:FkbM family methyltransferase